MSSVSNFWHRLRAALFQEQGSDNTVLRVRGVSTNGKRFTPKTHSVAMKRPEESPYFLNLLKPSPTDPNVFELLVDVDVLVESLQDAGLYDTVASNFRVSGNDLVYDRAKPDGTIVQAGITITNMFSGESDTLFDTGVPDNGVGNDGDEYLDTSTGIIYQKESGIWTPKIDLNTLDNQIASEVPFDPTGTAYDPGSTTVDKALKEVGSRLYDLESTETVQFERFGSGKLVFSVPRGYILTDSIISDASIQQTNKLLYQRGTVLLPFPAFNPFTVYKGTNGNFSTSVDTIEAWRAAFKPTTALVYYVDYLTGNDANDGLTQATCLKSIKAALLKSGTRTIYVKGDGAFYDYDSGFSASISSDNYVIIGYGDTKPVVGQFVPDFSGWAKDVTYTHTWKSSNSIASEIKRVFDTRFKNDYGSFKLYAKKSSIVEVDANPGSFYSDTVNDILYINTIGEIEPTYPTILPSREDDHHLCGITPRSITIYIEDINFYDTVHIRGDAVTSGNAYLRNCEVHYAHTSANQITVLGYNTGFYGVLLDEGGDQDGANYHKEGNISCKSFEINCTFLNNINGSSTADQLSSIHDGGQILRVNGLYKYSGEQVIYDINEGTIAVNLGCKIYGFEGTSYGVCVGYDAVGFNDSVEVYGHYTNKFAVGQNAGGKMYLWNCDEDVKLISGSAHYWGLSSDVFITKWDTTKSGVSSSNQIKLPLVSGGTYDFSVDFGDGTIKQITSYNQADVTHTYDNPGIYTVKIKGSIKGWFFGNAGDKLKLLEIAQWGPLKLVNSNSGYFQGCSNMVITAIDVLDLTGITTFKNMFRDCTSLTSFDVSQWDVSLITELAVMFYGCTNLSELDVSRWKTKSVTTVAYMFYNCLSLDNVPISSWDITNLTTANNLMTNTRLTTTVYDKLLIAWASQSVHSGVSIDFGSSLYTAGGEAEAARNTLVTIKGWTISDGGSI